MPQPKMTCLLIQPLELKQAPTLLGLDMRRHPAVLKRAYTALPIALPKGKGGYEDCVYRRPRPQNAYSLGSFYQEVPANLLASLLFVICTWLSGCGSIQSPLTAAQQTTFRALQKEETHAYNAALDEAGGAKRILDDCISTSSCGSTPTQHQAALALRSKIATTYLPRFRLGVEAADSVPNAVLFLALHEPPKQRDALLRSLLSRLPSSQNGTIQRASRLMSPSERSRAWLARVTSLSTPAEQRAAWTEAFKSAIQISNTATRDRRLFELLEVVRKPALDGGTAPQTSAITPDLQAFFEWAQEVDGLDLRVRLQLARRLAGANYPEKARNILERALAIARLHGDPEIRAELADIYSEYGATEAAGFFFDESGTELGSSNGWKAMGRALARAGDIQRIKRLLEGVASPEVRAFILNEAGRLAPKQINVTPLRALARDLGSLGGKAQASLALHHLKLEHPCTLTAAEPSACETQPIVQATLEGVTNRRGRMTVWMHVSAAHPNLYPLAEAEALSLFTAPERMEALMQLALHAAENGHMGPAMKYLQVAQSLASGAEDLGESAARFETLLSLAVKAKQAQVIPALYAETVDRATRASDPLRAAELLTRIAETQKRNLPDVARTVFSKLPRLREGPRSLLLQKWGKLIADHEPTRGQWADIVRTISHPQRRLSLTQAHVRLLAQHVSLGAALTLSGDDPNLIVEALQFAKAIAPSVAFNAISKLPSRYRRAQALAYLTRHSTGPLSTTLSRELRTIIFSASDEGVVEPGSSSKP